MLELHVSRERVASIKDYAIHYSLIVLGILTALGLEACIESRHHRVVADAATQSIDAELRENLKAVDDARKANVERSGQLKARREKIVAAINAGEPSTKVMADIVSLGPIDVGVQIPTLQRDAWEAALISQAVAHMPATRAATFSGVYAAQRDIAQAWLQTQGSSGLAARVGNFVIDRQLNRGDPAEFAKVLMEAELLLGSMSGNIATLRQALADAVGDTKSASTASPSPSASANKP
jgi:hypothetical protein